MYLTKEGSIEQTRLLTDECYQQYLHGRQLQPPLAVSPTFIKPNCEALTHYQDITHWARI